MFYKVEDYLELLILPPLLPKCGDYKCVQESWFTDAGEETQGLMCARQAHCQPSYNSALLKIYQT